MCSFAAFYRDKVIDGKDTEWPTTFLAVWELFSPGVMPKINFMLTTDLDLSLTV
jgi:hypothetical protein